MMINANMKNPNSMSNRQLAPPSHIPLKKSPSPADKIHSQIEQIKGLNFQLVNFSNHLGDSLRMKPTPNINKQFKSMFNQIQEKISVLIENIKQFYIQMDNKIKSVGQLIMETNNIKNIGENQISRTVMYRESKPSNHSFYVKNQSDDKFNELSWKINELEKSLEETKKNESKLITVIESLMNKYSVSQAPTIIKDDPKIHYQIMQERSAQPKPMNRIIEENSYIDESVVTSSLNKIKIKEKEYPDANRKYMNTFYSKSISEKPQQNSYRHIPKLQQGQMFTEEKGMTLKVNNKKVSQYSSSEPYQRQYRQNNDRKRRMDFMLSKLNG